jgi:hypothetical protein
MDSKKFKILISQCYLLAGQNIPEIVDVIALQVQNKIKDNYTDEEIEYVLDKGTYGEFGNYTGLSATVFVDWFKIYLKSDKRKFLKPQKQLPEKNKISKQEIEKIMFEATVECFNLYKNKKNIDHRLSSLYEYLKTKKIICLTEQDFSEIYNKARENVLVETNKRLFKANSSGKLNDINILSNLIKSITNNNTSQRADTLIDLEFNRIAIKRLFDKMIEMNCDITDYLNNND